MKVNARSKTILFHIISLNFTTYIKQKFSITLRQCPRSVSLFEKSINEGLILIRRETWSTVSPSTGQTLPVMGGLYVYPFLFPSRNIFIRQCCKVSMYNTLFHVSTSTCSFSLFLFLSPRLLISALVRGGKRLSLISFYRNATPTLHYI